PTRASASASAWRKRDSTSSVSIPTTRKRLSRDRSPETSATALSLTPSVAAMSAIAAAFARPSTGGAATRTWSESPWRPTIELRPAPGWTCTRTTTASRSTSYSSVGRVTAGPLAAGTEEAACTLRHMAFTPVPSALNLVELEARVLERWREQDAFGESLRRREGAPEWGFYEGPPPANAPPGIHPVWARICKDLYPRFHTMRGRYVARKGGWDCHGLPVEVQVEKALGITNKHEIEDFGIEAFNQRCRESVQRYVEDWSALTSRIGMWI